MQLNDKRDLKKSYKRLALFIAIVFLLDAFIAFLFLRYTSIKGFWLGVIIVAITCILYLLFILICAKIDDIKKKRLEKSNKKDPFSR